jgi:hypothetical protein
MPEVDLRRGVPRRPIYYTIDQVAAMLSMSVDQLKDSYLYLDGIDLGLYRTAFLRAVDFSVGRRSKNRPSTTAEGKEWRVAEGELIRWLTHHRLWLYPGDPEGVYDPTASAYERFAEQHDPLAAKHEDEELIFVRPDQQYGDTST